MVRYMSNELKAFTINMKSLSQDIADPIIIGAADANGRCLKIIFTQEAAAQFSEDTIVYLSWRHIQKNVKGYNSFTEIQREDTDELTASEQPPIWYIYYPKAMLHEGDVLAHIELVDDISVAASVNFNIHVLADPWDGTDWIEQDDLSEFKMAMNRAQHMQQIIDDAHEEIDAKLKELEELHDLIDWEDEDNNGINDQLQLPQGTEIVEWIPEGE